MGEWLKKTVKANPAKTVGGVVGLVLAILILTINFWRTLLLLILIGIGIYIGHRVDSEKGFIRIIEYVLNKLR